MNRLYHVREIGNKKYSVGDQLEFSGYNNFFKDYDTKDIPLVNTKKTIFQGLTYYWHFARETIFEEVRKNIDPNLPSRQRCLWLTDIRNLDYWMHTKDFHPETHQVLLLNLDGNAFKCDATFVEGNPKKLNDVREDAKIIGIKR
ncbi:DUF2441 domain-containing protein [Piscibacillus salipiscarius]|uniref:DUF2441 domain-containing protein n=1 Tax=Piscibacillus salipiscarius TaxID=299480 RepID=UPI0006D1FA55|nr:DUF2441 domain-containing protein [Piscibacillus salipiscarius]